MGALTLFLCGDVMTGRGIDQILPHPSAPRLFESFVKSARDYVELAERVGGKVARPVGWDYVWGDALAAFVRLQPDVRIANLETAVTRSEDAWPGKGIHYRMHPANVPCLAAAGLDCCVLANNHVLDWGYRGLLETLDALHGAGLSTAGAGRSEAEAREPAVIEVAGKGRVLVFGFAAPSSGVPPQWAAQADRAGVSLLPEPSAAAAQAIGAQIGAHRRAGDVVVVSIHWGPNWGYDIAGGERAFARRLIETAGVDLVHGHSSHHVKGIEVYRDRPIVYGCGDFLNDYEGIGGYESYRPDLALMYFPSFDPDGRLRRFLLMPMQIRRLRVNRAPDEGVRALQATLNRLGRKLGTGVERRDGMLELGWDR